MKFYIDESGSSGDLIHSGLNLDFNGQPVFSLAAVGHGEPGVLDELVSTLRQKHRVPSGELKSSSLRSKGDFILDLVSGLVDDAIPFFVEVVDKRYMICANMATTMVLPGTEGEYPYTLARARNGVADFLYMCSPTRVIELYLEACQLDSYHAVEEAMKALAAASFVSDPTYVGIAKLIPDLINLGRLVELRALADETLGGYRRFLPSPDINKRGQLVWMLPNLSCLTNVYARINRFHNRNIGGLHLIHDEQLHFDSILIDAKDAAEGLGDRADLHWTPLSDFKFDASAKLDFARSDQNVGLQVADVLAGLSMRVVRSIVERKRPDPAAATAFQMLFDAGNPSNSVGVNLVVTNSLFESLSDTTR